MRASQLAAAVMWLLLLGVVQAQEDQTTGSSRLRREDRVELRYAPKMGAVSSYKLTWQFGLDVPLSGSRHVDGEGMLHLRCEEIDETGLRVVHAKFEGFQNRMEGRVYNVNFPADGLILKVDRQRRIIETSHAVESIAAVLLKSFFATAFIDRRIEPGMSWGHELALLGQPEEGHADPAPAFWPDRPRAADVLPEDAEEEGRKQAQHVLAAASAYGEDDRLVGIISDIDLDFSLAAYGIGTTGRVGIEMTSEFVESTGVLRWARATGAGRLQTLAVVSVPVQDLEIVAALCDPRTGETTEPLRTYIRPAPPEETSDETSDAGDVPTPDAPQSTPTEELPDDHPLRQGR